MTTLSHDAFMQRAIELSEKAALIEKSGGAFGCVIVKDNQIIGEGYNQVIRHHDPTWHGEMQAIREACQRLQTPHLEGCILYTSAEPCPMCLGAAYWAHIQKIYYASPIVDAVHYGHFDDENFYQEFLKPSESRTLSCVSMPHMRDQAIVVWKSYAKLAEKKHY